MSITLDQTPLTTELGMPNMERITTVADMAPGARARVVEIAAPPMLALSILEIGIVKGAQIRHIRSAPLGGPIQVEVEGFLLSLRRDEAGAILVRTEDAGRPGGRTE